MRQRTLPGPLWTLGNTRTFKVFSRAPRRETEAKMKMGRLCSNAAARTAIQASDRRHVQYLILHLSPWAFAKGCRLVWARWMTDSWDAQMGHPTRFEDDELLVLVQDQRQKNPLAIWIFLRK